MSDAESRKADEESRAAAGAEAEGAADVEGEATAGAEAGVAADVEGEANAGGEVGAAADVEARGAFWMDFFSHPHLRIFKCSISIYV